MKRLLIALLLVGCGGGGDDGNDFESCPPPKCNEGAYTLYCPISNTCCPNNAPYLCGNACFEQPCGVGSVTTEVCAQEMVTAFCSH